MDIKKVGFIGPGKVGSSMGRYMHAMGVEISGYVGRSEYGPKLSGTEKATIYTDKSKILADSDILFLSVNDDAIKPVCDELVDKLCNNEYAIETKSKILCHFSGSLSSDILSSFRNAGGQTCSLHPIYPFNSKETPIEKMKEITFTIEGDCEAVKQVGALFRGFGNKVVNISTEKKTLYHCANVVISNLMIAEYEMALDLFEEAGIARNDAASMTEVLVKSNVENLLEKGSQKALTGPLERGDVNTLNAHINSLKGLDIRYLNMYRLLSERLIDTASQKNPGRDYDGCKRILGSILNNMEV